MNRRTTSRRRAIALVAGLGACGAIAGAGIAISQSPATPAEKSQAMTAVPAQPNGSDDHTQRFETESELRAEAARRAHDVPLPPGGSFDDIRWDQVRAGSASDIQGLLEANAACEWWGALADGRSADAAAVVQEIPSWSTMRDDANVGSVARTVASAARRGDMATVARMARDCSGSGRREGLQPSRYPSCSSPQARPDQPCEVTGEDES